MNPFDYIYLVTLERSLIVWEIFRFYTDGRLNIVQIYTIQIVSERFIQYPFHCIIIL